MHQELRPELQAVVDLREGSGVVLREFDPFPQFGRGVGALDGFHAEVEGAGGGGGADGGVAAVGEGAGLPVAEAGYVVGVAAEVLVFGCSVGRGIGY